MGFQKCKIFYRSGMMQSFDIFLVSDVMSDRSYLLIKIDLDGDISELDTSIEYINNNITASLKTVFGELGTGLFELTHPHDLSL